MTVKSHNTESPSTGEIDEAALGREIDRLHEAMTNAFKRSDELTEAHPAVRAKIEAAQRELREQLEAQEAANHEGCVARDQLLAALVEAKANVSDFKAFIKTHTHISYSTAKRMLDMQDPERAEQVRATERTRQQRHRTKAVTDNVTASNVVPFPTGEQIDTALSVLPLHDVVAIAKADTPAEGVAAFGEACRKLQPDDIARTVFLEWVGRELTNLGIGPEAEQENRDYLASVPADDETITAAKAAADGWMAVYEDLKARGGS